MADKSIHLAGGNNVTLSTATAANITSITFSGPNAGGAQTGISGISNSEVMYTSGTIKLSGENNITVRSETGQAFVFSGPNTHAQQTGLSALYDGANSISSGTVRLTNANNITFTINGQTLSGSVHAQQTGISGIQNTETTYTSGTVELEGTNNITVFSTTGQRFRISGANTHAQQTAISALYDGANSISSGTVRLTNANNITFTINGQTLSGSVHAQQTGVSGIANSETTYTSGTVQLVDLANITIRSTTGQKFEFSVAAPGGGGNFSAGASTGGNTAGDTGVTGTRLVFVGTNAVSLSQATDANGGTLSFNVTHTTHGHTNLSIGVSTGGNTSGDTTVNTGSRFVIVGSNNITASQGTAAGATTVTLSGPNTHPQETAMSVGVSNLGNTGGDTTVNVGSRLVFRGSNNITLSQTTAAGATTIGFNGGAGGGGGFSAGVSDLGNTAGSTGVTGTQLVLVGSNNITLSQSTDANGGTVSIKGAPPISIYRNIYSGGSHTPSMTALYGTPVLFPVDGAMRPFPGEMTARTMMFRISNSGSTATMSQANSVTVDIAIYTMNSTRLSLLNSATTSWGNAASTNNSTSTAGGRWVTIHSSLWSANPTFSQVPYWMYLCFRTSGVSMQTFNLAVAEQGSFSASGTAGVATVANASLGIQPYYGVFTASTASPPTTIASSYPLNKTNNAVTRGVPALVFLDDDAPKSF